MAVILRIAEGMPSGRSLVLSSGSFSNATSAVRVVVVALVLYGGLCVCDVTRGSALCLPARIV
eukprot:scaffold4945_cov46-Cyclotella_meneghiniana.AAC.6